MKLFNIYPFLLLGICFRQFSTINFDDTKFVDSTQDKTERDSITALPTSISNLPEVIELSSNESQPKQDVVEINSNSEISPENLEKPDSFIIESISPDSENISLSDDVQEAAIVSEEPIIVNESEDLSLTLVDVADNSINSAPKKRKAKVAKSEVVEDSSKQTRKSTKSSKAKDLKSTKTKKSSKKGVPSDVSDSQVSETISKVVTTKTRKSKGDSSSVELLDKKPRTRKAKAGKVDDSVNESILTEVPVKKSKSTVKKVSSKDTASVVLAEEIKKPKRKAKAAVSDITTTSSSDKVKKPRKIRETTESETPKVKSSRKVKEPKSLTDKTKSAKSTKSNKATKVVADDVEKPVKKARTTKSKSLKKTD